MSKELAITNFQEMQDMAKVFIQSGMFPDVKTQSQAIVKILAGKELGLGPFAAMRGVDIIKGKAAPNSSCIANLIKKSGKYDYRIKKMTDEVCVIEFLQDKESIGESSFSMSDAKKAGLSGGNYSKYPRNMLFARALTNGARWYCADVFAGAIYTQEEAQEIEEQEEIHAELEAIDNAAAEDEARMRAANSERMKSEKLERALETGEYIMEFGSKKGQPISKVDNGIFLKKHLDKYMPDMSEYAIHAIEARMNELREEYKEKLAAKKEEELAALARDEKLRHDIEMEKALGDPDQDLDY